MGGSYTPRAFRALTFHDAAQRFAAGQDNPRAYLEACLETIAAREPVVRAFVVLNEAGARRGIVEFPCVSKRWTPFHDIG